MADDAMLRPLTLRDMSRTPLPQRRTTTCLVLLRCVERYLSESVEDQTEGCASHTRQYETEAEAMQKSFSLSRGTRQRALHLRHLDIVDQDFTRLVKHHVCSCMEAMCRCRWTE